jgi:hypothetical protein
MDSPVPSEHFFNSRSWWSDATSLEVVKEKESEQNAVAKEQSFTFSYLTFLQYASATDRVFQVVGILASIVAGAALVRRFSLYWLPERQLSSHNDRMLIDTSPS